EAHDPAVFLWAATLGRSGPRTQPTEIGGAGFTVSEARFACVGEAIERHQAYPLRSDGRVLARFDDWPLSEPAIPPESWILFHRDQYRAPAFPFRPLERQTECHWVCFRRLDGEPVWVPEDFAF